MDFEFDEFGNYIGNEENNQIEEQSQQKQH